MLAKLEKMIRTQKIHLFFSESLLLIRFTFIYWLGKWLFHHNGFAQTGLFVISVVLSLTLKPLFVCSLFSLYWKREQTQSNLILETKGRRATVFKKNKKECEGLVLQVFGAGPLKRSATPVAPRRLRKPKTKMWPISLTTPAAIYTLHGCIFCLPCQRQVEAEACWCLTVPV